MRIQVEYSDDGSIKSAALSGPNVSSGRIPSPNHRIAVIETEEVKHERDLEGLRFVVENHRIIGHPHEPRLARKELPATGKVSAGESQSRK
jgi:hypothetical protein